MKIKFLKYLFFLILFLFFKNSIFSNYDIPDFKYILQRPSYITQIGSGTYLCDTNKTECKVNFKLVDLEEKDISSKIECRISSDFDLGTFKDNCNPTTIIIPNNSEKIIKFRIYEKNNLQNFKEKEILIKNTSEEVENLEENIQSNTSSGIISEANNGIISIPDFKYILQRPSYVREKSENNLECDSSKDECKLNLKFVTLDEKDISSKFECTITTEFNIGEEKNKCNPNTIIIPRNTNQNIKIKLYEKNNQLNFIEKNIIIKNKIEHHLPYSKILVQGRKSKYRKIGISNMKCLTYNKCSINFTAGEEIKGVYYEWDFGNGNKFYGANPKSQKYKPGFYLVKFTTQDTYGTRKTEYYRVRVIKIFKKSEQKLLKNSIYNIVSIRKNILLDLNKKTNITKIINKNITKKIVKNLNKKKIKKFLTVKNIFGKGVKIARKKFNKKKIAKNNKLKKISKKGINLKKKKILISSKEKLLKKNIKLHISFQKKALKISGKTFAKSKVEIKIGKQKFKTFSNNSGKYVFKINNLTAGKYKILASVYNNKGVLIARKKSREKIISKKYISQLNHYKYKKYLSLVKKKYKKHKKKIKNKFKKYKISILSPPKKEIKLNKFNIKIFIINILITILISILTSLVLIRKKII